MKFKLRMSRDCTLYCRVCGYVWFHFIDPGGGMLSNGLCKEVRDTKQDHSDVLGFIAVFLISHLRKTMC